jgi:hypothetical protein
LGYESSERAAKAAVEAYIEGFNARDAARMADAFNFPHIRLAKGRFTIIDSREQFIERQDAVTALLVEEGWDHTVLESIAIVHAGADKVHLGIEYTRRSSDGIAYTRFETLWIATSLDGHWGVQFRSSFLTSDASTLAEVTPAIAGEPRR